MERYDREIEIRDTEIQVLKEKREEQFNRIRELSELVNDSNTSNVQILIFLFQYNQHKHEIKEYLKLKEIRHQEEERLRRNNLAATRLQAWWRGVMVRRCLGKFSKKKGGKKDKDKKKGKKQCNYLGQSNILYYLNFIKLFLQFCAVKQTLLQNTKKANIRKLLVLDRRLSVQYYFEFRQPA